jgi:hypothetical protein
MIQIYNHDEITQNLRDCIARLFNIQNLITHAGSKVSELSECLIKAVNQIDFQKVKESELELFDRMTIDELRRMAGIEHERRTVMDTWRALELRKQELIELARSRIASQQGDVQ